MHGFYAAPCIVLRDNKTAVAGFDDIRPVASNHQVARRIVSNGGADKIHKFLIEGVQENRIRGMDKCIYAWENCCNYCSGAV